VVEKESMGIRGESLKIVVLGLWHLGCVTSACSARFFDVVGLDFDGKAMQEIRSGRLPVFEPGLADLVTEGLSSGRLSFEMDAGVAMKGADLLWVCYDTPVDEEDQPELTLVYEGIERCMPYLAPGAHVLISSQVPAGTCRFLEGKYTGRHFSYSPENLRLGKAVDLFLNQDRIILGTRSQEEAGFLVSVLEHFSTRVMIMRTESAEMVKHGVNAFLGLSIVFMNEMARICEKVGADAREVESGLKSESRIGGKAYLSPGGAFAGGTLARDIVTLDQLARCVGEKVFLIPGIKLSNDQHKRWSLLKLKEELGELSGKRVAVLGLAYKADTDTLRRSLAIDLCRWLSLEGAEVTGFDPLVAALPADLHRVRLSHDLVDASKNADALVVCTQSSGLLEAPWPLIIAALRTRIVIDPGAYLLSKVSGMVGLGYRYVGSPS
jgi:UDPglucose 6-dehydrogenase